MSVKARVRGVQSLQLYNLGIVKKVKRNAYVNVTYICSYTKSTSVLCTSKASNALFFFLVNVYM